MFYCDRIEEKDIFSCFTQHISTTKAVENKKTMKSMEAEKNLQCSFTPSVSLLYALMTASKKFPLSVTFVDDVFRRWWWQYFARFSPSHEILLWKNGESTSIGILQGKKEQNEKLKWNENLEKCLFFCFLHPKPPTGKKSALPSVFQSKHIYATVY